MDVAPDSGAFAGPSSRRSSAGQLDDAAWDGSAPLELRSKGRSQKVLGACAPCKRAHLACEPARPCRRCVAMAREDQCIDLPQKKRGRPKLSAAAGAAGGPSHKVPRTAPVVIDPSSRRRPSDPHQHGPRTAPAAYPPSHPRQGANEGGGMFPFSQQGAGAPPPPGALSSSAPAQALFAADYSLAPTAAAPPQRGRPLSMILLTTTDFFLLRASESSVAVLGKPSATLERSWMSDLLPSDDLLALYPLCQWLVSPPGVHLSTDQEAEHAIDTAAWSKLTQAAEGTPYPEKEIRLRRGDGTFVGVNLRMHLGSGAGLDFKHPETFSKAYIVVSCVVSDPSPPSTAAYPAATSALSPRPKSATDVPAANGRPMSGPTQSAYHLDPHGPSPVALAARQFMRPMPSLPSISTLTNEVDLAQRARATLSAGGGPAPTFLNPFASSSAAAAAAPMHVPSASTSQTFRFQQPRPPTSDGIGRRPHGIVLPPPTMVGFGGSRLASPGIYGQHQRPMSTESGHHAGGSLAKDGLPAFGSFAARGSIASIESTFSAAPSEALWSPSVMDEPPPRRRGSALRLGTGDSSNSTMDGIVTQPLEPPAFPFPAETLHLRPGSRQ